MTTRRRSTRTVVSLAKRIAAWLGDYCRGGTVLLLGACALAGVLVIAPHKGPVMGWLAAKLLLGGYGGYLIWRALFRVRLHKASAQLRPSIILGRAIVIGACVVGVLLGAP